MYLILLLLLQFEEPKAKQELLPFQYKPAGSECVWSFKRENGEFFIAVDTHNNLLISEYAAHFNPLILYVGDIDFKTKTKPILSKDGRRIFYYSGRVVWRGRLLENENHGSIHYRECTQEGKCRDFIFSFENEGDKWDFSVAPNAPQEKT